jgi:large subunit ribosomal protein L9
MKVILLKEIANLGKAYEVKEVSDGYARNFLFVKGLALPATPEMLAKVEAKKKKEEKELQKRKERVEEIARRLEGQTVIIKERVGEMGKLYGSVSVSRIAKVLKRSGFEVKEDQIKLSNPLKEVGEFPVEIDLGYDQKIKIKVLVQPI